MIGLVEKIWRRKGYFAKALGNWGLHLTDTAALRNKGEINGKKIIVFVRVVSDIRLFKEAQALKNTGRFYTVFFTRVINRGLMRSAFDEIHPLFGVDAMVEKIKKLSTKSEIAAIHTSSPTADICRRLIEMKLPWPVIFDQYDAYFVSFGPNYKNDNVSTSRLYDIEQQIENERFCYENADGIISKTDEIDYVKSLLNIRCPCLIYPDYALEDWFVNCQKPLRTADGRPHLVYAGGVHGKSMPDDIGYSKFFDFARNLNKQQIHFHIYPSPCQTIVAEDYAQLDKELAFFHFHKSKKPWEIQKKIVKCDFALDVAWYEKSSVRLEKKNTATGNKYATYLEAGLPIIANEHLPYIANCVEKEQIGFVISDDNSLIDEGPFKKRQEYQKKVLAYRNTFNCVSHVDELIELYDRCVKETDEKRRNG